MAVQLLARLYPASGRQSISGRANPDTTYVETANTYAGTHDGLDTTVDRAVMTWTGDPAEIDGDSDMAVAYTLDTCVVTDAISFVRFCGRSRLVGVASPNNWAFINARVNARSAYPGPPQPVLTTQDGWVNWTMDFPTFDAAQFGGAGQAWTAALINANKFGFHLGPDWGVGLTLTAEQSEFHLEVWGTGPAEVAVGVALLAELQKIGTAPASQWQVPSAVVVDQLPNDAPDAPTAPRIYLQYARTEMRDGTGPMGLHIARVVYEVWIASNAAVNSIAEMLRVRSDVLKVLFASESSFFQNYKYGVWLDTFTYHPEITPAGMALGVQEVHVDVALDRTTP